MKTPIDRAQSCFGAAVLVVVLSSACQLWTVSGGPATQLDLRAAGTREVKLASSEAAVGLGTLIISIAWPDRQVQVIPLSTQWIRLQINKGDTKVSDLQLARPTDNGASTISQASIQLAAASGLTARAEAFRLAPNATGDLPLATATRENLIIRPNERTAVTLVLAPVFIPSLSSISPTNGGPGVPVNLSGNFSNSGYYGIDVAGVRGPGRASGSALVVANIPTNAKTGPVSALDDGVPSNAGSVFRVLVRLDLQPQANAISKNASLSFSVPSGLDTATTSVANPTLTRWEVVDPTQVFSPFPQGSNVGTITSNGVFTATATGTAWVRVFSGALMATAPVIVN